MTAPRLTLRFLSLAALACLLAACDLMAPWGGDDTRQATQFSDPLPPVKNGMRALPPPPAPGQPENWQNPDITTQTYPASPTISR